MAKGVNEQVYIAGVTYEKAVGDKWYPVHTKPNKQVPVQEVLNVRGSNYGAFDTHAAIVQNLKAAARVQNWDKLRPDQKEAIEMIMHKIGRIINGKADYKDSWIDIAGYATLVANTLKD